MRWSRIISFDSSEIWPGDVDIRPFRKGDSYFLTLVSVLLNGFGVVLKRMPSWPRYWASSSHAEEAIQRKARQRASAATSVIPESDRTTQSSDC